MMPVSDYKRCPKCKELVANVDDCENCKFRDPERAAWRWAFWGERHGAATLDMIEGNWEEWH